MLKNWLYAEDILMGIKVLNGLEKQIRYFLLWLPN